ncbi:hypothetical protein TNCT_718391 [Trichonephila clavata]|uniref:Uncharacterized protein n=1 Tax=Trichonephila clavata TaxID=2740835 RepID=A0A8X6ILS1_TRICU|nr:hypothetical protein TNCT_718391 [Trichonephila clavata]
MLCFEYSAYLQSGRSLFVDFGKTIISRFSHDIIIYWAVEPAEITMHSYKHLMLVVRVSVFQQTYPIFGPLLPAASARCISSSPCSMTIHPPHMTVKPCSHSG